MQMLSPSAPSLSGVVVHSQVKAGRLAANHAEGIVVSTAVKAGRIATNHSEGVVAPAARC